VIGIAGDFEYSVQPPLVASPESRGYLTSCKFNGVTMFRTVLSIAFLSAVVAVASTANSAEADAEKCAKSANCEKGQCDANACTGESCPNSTGAADCCASKSKSCTGESCSKSASAGEGCANKVCAGFACASQAIAGSLPRLIHLTTKIDSGADDACDKSSCDKNCCDSSQKPACCAIDELAGNNDASNGFAGLPAIFAISAPTPPACERGNADKCHADAGANFHQHIAALHSRLVQETTKNALLTVQLKHVETLAKAHVEFAKQMLEKEVEVAHLHAELRLTEMRSKANQEVAETVFEFERVKASLESVCTQCDAQKLELARRNSDHAEALAASHAANAGLVERVADLEKHLDSIHVRLASEPTGIQVK
jgi:hypothetical protein